MTSDQDTRRKFLQLGLAAAGSAVFACPTTGQPADPNTPSLEIDLEKWSQLKGAPYELGKFGALPGVCELPGPLAKRNWPDRNKYRNVEQIPGMCQLCSTVCGIVGYVKEGRLIKIEGNPKDPNSRGRVCARGHHSRAVGVGRVEAEVGRVAAVSA